MKVLFIGTICDEIFFDGLINNSKFKPSIAGQNFERDIVEGINKECPVEVMSVLPIAPYPKYQKTLIIKKNNLFGENINIKYIPFINISVIKQLSILISTFFMILKWFFRNVNRDKIILLNLVYPPTAMPVLLLSRIFKCPVTVVVPDVSTFRFDYSPTRGLFRKALISIFKKICENIDNKFNGYILLTEEMNNLINTKNKPHLIIEGMTRNHFCSQNKVALKNNEIRVIMYAGSLKIKYGIQKLIKAFEGLKSNDIELWIFGAGDYEDSIIKMAEKNKRIHFFGLVSHENILKYEIQATLLVNPRPSNEEFTKYSFPSKTIEYMASGTPLLTTKLSGIPDDYWKYVYTFSDETIEGMTKSIELLLSKSNNELMNFGNEAREYILENKNYLVQSKKIVNFLQKIVSLTQ